jgi:hypothetical protein
MDILPTLKLIAALATAATGLLAFLKPAAIYGFTGLAASGARGVSEIRSIFGGLFLALGLAPLFLDPPAYLVLGISYLGIAAARTVSLVLDRSFANSNLASLAIEIVFGILLILN